MFENEDNATTLNPEFPVLSMVLKILGLTPIALGAADHRELANALVDDKYVEEFDARQWRSQYAGTAMDRTRYKADRTWRIGVAGPKGHEALVTAEMADECLRGALLDANREIEDRMIARRA